YVTTSLLSRSNYTGRVVRSSFPFFFFNHTATTEIYTLSLHDALPICSRAEEHVLAHGADDLIVGIGIKVLRVYQVVLLVHFRRRSEEHTSELQSRENLVCRLLLEKKKKKKKDLKNCTIDVMTNY